jgi:hypothetical protein
MEDDGDGKQELFTSSDITTARTVEEYLIAQALSDSGHHDNFISLPIDANFDFDSDSNPLSLSIENIIFAFTPSPITPSYTTNPPPLSLPSLLGAPSSLSHSPRPRCRIAEHNGGSGRDRREPRHA